MMLTANCHTTDKTIRGVLIKQIKKTYDKTHRAAIIPEFSLSDTGTRADIAVVNGILHGYELKGDSDTLTRLPGQVDGYNAIFDMVTIVVGKKHILGTVQTVPEWWGIVLAKNTTKHGEPLLIEIRPPSQNRYQSIETVVQLLWKEEVISILRRKQLYQGLSSATKGDLCNLLISSMSPTEIKTYVREYIIARNQNYLLNCSTTLEI